MGSMRFLRQFVLIGIVAMAGLGAPAFAQSEDEEAPVPIPRPAHLGGEETVDGADEPDGPPRTISLITDPQPVTLSARTTDDGPFIPDGLVWRVFDTRTDETGELAMLAKSEEATASLSLPPGEYVLHVAFGRAQASDTLHVEPGPNTKTIVLEVGGLQLDAAVTGDIDIPDELLRFDIFSNGPSGRVTIAEGAPSGELLHLNAGVYNVISHFGPINAVVRADLRVEPGQITEATLYHKAAQINLKLVSEEGGEAIADVEWTVKSTTGETLFTDIGAFPSTVLAEGEYLALAKLGENIYNREFEVQPGAPREVEILTAVY
jgi:hypothetical protein